MATVNYTEEFKKEAVKLLLESDLPKAKLASNLGVKYNANQGLKNNQDNCQHMC